MLYCGAETEGEVLIVKRVFPPIAPVLAIIAPLKVKSTDYRLTQFCLRAPCAEGELLYNTLTGELILLETGESPAQLRDELIARRFLVPADCEEFAEAKQLRTVLRLMQPQTPGADHFLIFTTSDCNARCYYCYELGRPRMPMSDATAEETADYILRQSGDREVSIIWFGGEPLYNRAAVDRIARRLREAGKSFHSKMVSNGYLFDEDTVQSAVRDWALRSVQIPLDGTEEVYNRVKAFVCRDCPSPYQRVMDNIRLLLDAGVSVSIRLNLGVNNYEDLMALIQELAVRFPDQKGLHVYVTLLQDFGTAPQTAVDDNERLARWRRLNDLLRDSGLRRRGGLSAKLSLSYCMADRDGCVTIAPDGSIGKCEHECDREPLGHIRGGTLDKGLLAAWKEQVQTDACPTCALFPLCLRLKKCAWTRNTCLPIDREILRDNTVDRMLCTYETKSGSSADGPDSFGDVC